MPASAAYLDLIKPPLRSLLTGQAHVRSLMGNASECLIFPNMLAGEVQR